MNTSIFWENFLRVVAVIGLIAVLLLGAWGIIQLAFFIPSLFNNSGSPIAPSGETLSVSAPASVTAGQPFALNWAHQGGSGDYSYSISYACGSSLSIAAPVPTGAFQLVTCGTPFNYINASSSMTLVPVLATSTNQANANFTVTATKLSSGAITATGNATVSASAPISPSPTASKPYTAPTKSTSSAPATRYVSSGRTTNLYGYPDLAVRILSASSQGGAAVVRFEINNDGTNVTPYGWSFNALLPINGQYTYPSGPQRALYPGDYIIYTLNYSTGSNSSSGYNYSGYTGGCPTNNNYYGGYGYTLPYSTGTPCAPYSPQTCNSYGPCAVPGYASNYPYYNNSGYNSSYNYGYGGQSTVAIEVDPYNQIRELTKANNYASTSYTNY